MLYLRNSLARKTDESTSFKEGLFMGVIPYLPGDAVKIIIAVIVGPKLYAATKKVR